MRGVERAARQPVEPDPVRTGGGKGLLNDDQARTNILSRLQPGEQLIWYGSPPPLSAVWNGPLVQLLFALFFLGFALFWTWGAAHAVLKNGSAPVSFFPLFGLLFVGIGLYQLVSAVHAIWGCWFTAYGLTDRRVIIAIGLNGTTQSLWPDSLSRMERRGGQERGTLRFDSGVRDYRRGRTWQPQPAFVDIRDPAKVEALIYTHLLNRRKEGAAL